jgi:lipopolysaccharide export system permease protein
MTIFDKYILKRFLHTFVVLFMATFGLYVVFDLFTNVDAFQEGGADTATMVRQIVTFYGYQAVQFFELIGTVLVVISAMIVLAMMQKRSEFHPVLAAGIPAFRIAIPLVIGAVAVNGLLIANQEVLIPSIAHELQTARGSEESQDREVEPVHDHFNYMMLIDGETITPATRTLHNAIFTLPTALVSEVITIDTTEAIYHPQSSRGPGWLLKDAREDLKDAHVTEQGRKVILPTQDDDVFIVSKVSFDQLYNRGSNYKLLSASELVHRIRNPATGFVPIRPQGMHLHFRVTRPLINIATVLLTIPLILKRESRSLVTNMAVCTLVLGVFYGIMQASLYLGTSSLLATDYAAWLPVVATGGAAAWFAASVQT